MELAQELQQHIQVQELPAFKSTLTKLVKELSSKARTPDSLAQIVEKDPVLACRVLRLVNGPMYKPFGKNIYEVKRALNILGENALYTLLTQIPPMRDNLLDDDLAVKREYVKSATCVELSKQVLEKKTLPFSDIEFAYSAMHRYGYVALANFYPEIWHTVKLAVEAGEDLDSALLQHGISKAQMHEVVFENLTLEEDVADSVKNIVQNTSKLTDKIYETTLDESVLEDFSSALGVPVKFLESAIERSKAAVLASLDTSKDVLGIEHQPTELSTSMLLTRGIALLRKQFETTDVISYASAALDLLKNSLDTHRTILFLNVKDEVKAIKGFEDGQSLNSAILKNVKFVKSEKPSNTFEVCMSQHRMIRLDDPKKVKNPPFWSTYFGDVKEIMLLPLSTSTLSIGLFYLDWKAGSIPWITEKVRVQIEEIILLLSKKMEAERAKSKLH